MPKQIDFILDTKSIINNLTERQSSGKMEKPFIELFQNSYDGKAKNIWITLTMQYLEFIDDGIGMDYDRIMDHFRVVGHSSKTESEEEAGEFGIGRFQYCNQGVVEIWTHEYYIVIDIKKSHSFLLEEGKEFFNGMKVRITFYNPLEKEYQISSHLSSFKSSIILPPNTSIYFNSQEYKPQYTINDDLSNDKYLVIEGNYKYDRELYSQFIKVCRNTKTSFHYGVICLQKMKLNFARNEFIVNDEKTKELNEKIAEVEKYFIKRERNFDLSQCSKILTLVKDGELKYDDIKDKKIVPQTNGTYYSLEDLKKNPVLFGEKDIWSDDCIQRGNIVIRERYRNLIVDIASNFGLNFMFKKGTVRDHASIGYHREVNQKTLNQKAQLFFKGLKYLNELVFSDYVDLRNIRVGDSDIASAWTDGDTDIYINKGTLNRWKTLNEALLDGWSILSHEYSHDEDTIEQDYHNQWFYEAYHKITRKTSGLLHIAIKKITKANIIIKYPNK